MSPTRQKYRLLRELGRGTSGVVYRALQIDLNREVALKLLGMESPRGRRQLDISPTMLTERIKRYGLKPPS